HEPHAPRHGAARERPERPRPRRLPQSEELQDQRRRPRREDPRAVPLDDEADRSAARAAAETGEELDAYQLRVPRYELFRADAVEVDGELGVGAGAFHRQDRAD